MSPFFQGLKVLILSVLFLGGCQPAFQKVSDPMGHMDLTRKEMICALNMRNTSMSPIIDCSRPFSLEQCRQIALSNNLDLLSSKLSELSHKYLSRAHFVEIAPRLLFEGQYDVKDNEVYSYSDVLGFEGQGPDSGPGDGVTHYSTAQERNRWRHLLEIRWSPTDAALSYYLSRSAKNDQLRAHYERVRLTQKLMETIDSSFHRILSCQRAIPMAEKLVNLRKQIADSSRELSSDQLIDVESYQIMKMELAKAKGYLSRLRTDLTRSRSALLYAMGLTPDHCSKGIHLIGQLDIPCYRPKLCDVELAAVNNRPEAYQAGLARLKSIDHLRTVQVERFPKVTLFWSRTGDTNKFLYNNDWKEFGILAQMDLIDWLSKGNQSKSKKLDSQRTKVEMSAVALTLSSQARMAALDYFAALERLKTVEESLSSASRLYENAKKKNMDGALDRLTLKKTQADLIFEKIEQIRLIGETNACVAKLRSAMGLNYHESVQSN